LKIGKFGKNRIIMPKFSAQSKVSIKADSEKIYNVVTDFSQWRGWSPWLIMEPEATVDVAEDNKSYSWKGKRIGSGNMKITKENPNQSFTSDLNFIKPFKSYAEIIFELKPNGDETEVTWVMHSSLPFFMFWMTKTMITLMEMDFSRGLNMLKEYVEEGEVHSKIDFKGESQMSAGKYIGIKNSSPMEKIGDVMSADFEKLWSFMEDKSDLIDGNGLSIYHKWDLKKRQTEFTTGVQVKSAPDTLPEGMFLGEMPATKIYTIRHTGPYTHLGNAWSTGQNLIRSKTFKPGKATHPFELYQNVPGKVSDNELITDINFAVK
jgi:effector-binding domain-containing protein